MSLAVPSQLQSRRPLTLEIPSNSLLAPEPFIVSTSPTSPTLNVKFAPLPQLSPRRRRSSVVLGMAGRGQLLPRGGKRAPQSPIWTDDGPQEFRLQQEELAAQDARLSAFALSAAARKGEEEVFESEQRHRKSVDHLDEPLHTLGRIVKGAGKTLWKRVSHRDVAATAAISIPKSESDSDTSGSPTSINSFSPVSPDQPVFKTIITNVEGRNIEDEDWEEEIGSNDICQIQPQTIIEGRLYSHFTSKVEALSRSPPPSPSVLNSARMSSFTFTKPPTGMRKAPRPIIMNNTNQGSY